MEGHLTHVHELNEIIRRGDLVELMCREEMRHIERISRIAERVAAQVPGTRLVLLAGPSSAGKTTSAIRLCTRLRENGLEPLRLSTDDYFGGPAFNPRNPDGTVDYESIRCVDCARLARDLSDLLDGKPVHLRRFDFLTHAGSDDAEAVRLSPNGVIVLEGIHALNPELTPDVDESAKFRVYVNVFTALKPDDPSSVFFVDDVRLVRRIVRDSNFRNEPAVGTLRRWPSVEAGERTWINPFRRLADAVFNTGLDYELAVLRPYALDLLRGVEPTEPEYREAQRLIATLAAVSEAPSAGVAGNSILRETIGGSSLVY